MRSRQHITRDEVTAPNGIVATRRPAESEAGVAMLKAGGNAIDAAVAVGFLATVVEPMMVGLAGCGFLLYHDAASAKNWAVDFGPRAPAGARADMFEVMDVEAGPR